MRKLTIVEIGDEDYAEILNKDGEPTLLMLPTNSHEVDVHAYNQKALGGIPRHEAKLLLYKTLYGDIEVIRKEKDIDR